MARVFHRLSGWRRKGLACLGGAFAALFCLTGPAHAGGCDLVKGGSLSDHVGQIVHVQPMTVLLVTRFEAASATRLDQAKRSSWTDDEPSKALPSMAICEAVQMETPVPLDGTWDGPAVMQQGERLSKDVRLRSVAPALATRMDEHGRKINVPAGPMFVYQVLNFDDMDWRFKVLRAAERAGRIDRSRWMVALPGALYLVPVHP